MNIKATITTLVILAAICASGEVQRTVTVCMDATLSMEVVRARAQASRMFAVIGVKLDWRCPRSGLLKAIVISVAARAPEGRKPGVLAYALPYEGTHIVIFYDRVSEMTPNQVPALLAHVIVHEVTHILQGVGRHSDSGVMKAHWDARDFSQMRWRPLPFTDHDIDLIHRGLDVREARNGKATLVASNVP